MTGSSRCVFSKSHQPQPNEITPLYQAKADLNPYRHWQNPNATGNLAQASLLATRAGVKLLPEVSRSGRITQQGLEHIVARHWPTSGAKMAGKFSQGTTIKSLRSMINTTIEKGMVRANTRGRPGHIFEYDFGSQIGVTSRGIPASSVRVVRMPDGTIKTAFPF